MQTTEDQTLVIGQVGSAHGVRGWVTVHSYTDPAENIFNYTPWQLAFPNGKRQTVVIKHQRLGNKIIVQFVGYDDRDMACTLTGAEIIASRAQLPPLPAGEYYWNDLIGLTVITTTGQTLGVITQFFSTGANDVFAVVGDKRYMLPYLLKQVVLEIDLAQKIMRVNWDPDF